MVASFLTFVRSQSTSRRSQTATSNDSPQGRTLGLISPILGGLTRRRPIGLGGLGALGGLAGGGLQSDPIYGGGYGGYGGGYGGYGGGYGGYGGYPLFGGYPGLFGGYAPYAYRPRPYYPLYGGYNPYAAYQRPSYGSYGSDLNSLAPSQQTASTSTSGFGTSGLGSGTSGLGSGTGAGSTAAQAQIANQLGQTLGASLRPLLMSGGGLGGAGGAGGAGGLASLLGLLG
ncbi:PREDICTED: prisilkin-39 [Rhagoletis zephyria]|uniref:prisilkin-39 n=1 Tax=Rhagoletis zephyria TaxID=28612 RepID=UPI000811A2B2|nr:PREDICTED: prisilkin-39 [Rhagoletis zephyria]